MVDVAIIALGSNLGDRDAHLAFARRRMASLPASRLVAESAIEETLPLGGMQQPPYLNQVVALETSLPPRELLTMLHALENERGRRRSMRWGARTLDLDLVRYGHAESTDPTLTLPHPGFSSRDFWQRGVAAVLRQLSASA
ncbi:MAG: 2-amino-4-hydroxy-6-hydroxymethyldihydropteridine diphosphokinase [Gemmatimonadaceae bacterium]